MTAASDPQPGSQASSQASSQAERASREDAFFTLRDGLFFAALAAAVAAVFVLFGAAFGLRMLAEASCYAIIALGLTLQWGYAGLFNVGVMGFVALGGLGLILVSGPVEAGFWASSAPSGLLLTVAAALVAALLAWLAATRLPGLGVAPARARVVAAVLVGAGAIAFLSLLGPVVDAVESGAASDRGYIGGLGAPAWLGWIAGAAIAALVGWGVARACLGLRGDYLAIATLGVAEIIKAVLKNEDWLTRGTATLSPLPWPTPTPRTLQEVYDAPLPFEIARALHLCVTALVIALLFVLIDRAYRAPWGRMIRAIRDNDAAAAAVGKDVDRRRMEIFVLGSALMGLGGAALIGFTQIFDPSGFHPLNHTFLIWVMVIVGGSGNNLGALFGALLVYMIFILSEPLALALFAEIARLGDVMFGWTAPSDFEARALQMRVFVIGLTIALALRYAPRGAIPERPPRPL